MPFFAMAGELLEVAIIRLRGGKGGSKPPVPNVTGVDLERAHDRLVAAGFVVEVVRTGDGVRVVQQEPSAGSRLRRWSPVRLTVH